MGKFFGRLWDNILGSLVAAWLQSTWQTWGISLMLASLATYALQEVEQIPITASVVVFVLIVLGVLFLAHILFVGDYAGVALNRRSFPGATPETDKRSINLFYDEHDPNCHQRDGRVVGGGVEYDETIYRIGIYSETHLRRCRLVLAYVEPQPNDPGQQRIGLAMRPRIPSSGGSEEFTINPGSPAFVDVLQETMPRPNPLNESSTVRLIYSSEDRGHANWFENGDYVLTFRLEGPESPVNYRLAVKFDGRRQYRRWRVGPA